MACDRIREYQCGLDEKVSRLLSVSGEDKLFSRHKLFVVYKANHVRKKTRVPGNARVRKRLYELSSKRVAGGSIVFSPSSIATG